MTIFGFNESAQQDLPQLQASHVVAVAAKDDVSAASGHIRGDGDSSSTTGLGDNLGYISMDD